MHIDLSVIIPIYNAEKYIGKCLDSILKQDTTFLNFEVIMVNDGSTDNSLKVLKDYEGLFANVLVYDTQNMGAGSARNIGIENAKGTYLWFIDADDFINDQSFKNIQYSIIHGMADIIIFDYYIVNESSRKKVKSSFPKDEITLSNYISNAQGLYLWKHLYRSELIVNSHLRFIEGIKNIEDFEFNVRFFEKAKTIHYLEASLYNYFQSEGSTSRNFSKDNLNKLASDSQIVHRSLKKIFTDNKSSSKVVKDLLDKSIIGFFYSLYKFNYTYPDLKRYYSSYKAENLLPTKITNKNLKFTIFEFIVNTKYIYLILSFVKKKIFN